MILKKIEIHIVGQIKVAPNKNIISLKMETFYKQFLIRSLKLPYELCEEINAYVFYDKDTTEVRNQVRKHFRNTCVVEINNASSNRKDGGGTSIDAAVASGTIGFRGETEDWSFHTFYEYTREICAVNCRFCGNYLMSNTQIITNHKLMCFCKRNIIEFIDLINDWTVNFTRDMWDNAHVVDRDNTHVEWDNEHVYMWS